MPDAAPEVRVHAVYRWEPVCREAWSAFVATRAESVVDLPEWADALADAYGIRSHVLVAERVGRIVGGAMFAEIRHAVFGAYLTTAAFGTDGGWFAGDASTQDALVSESRGLMRRLGCRHAAIRTRDGAGSADSTEDRFVSSSLDLESDADAQFARLPSKTRNQVRRGQREGFTVAHGIDQLTAFVDVFQRHMRDLGTPAHGEHYYRAIAARFGERCRFYAVRDGEEIVAGALLFFVNGTAANVHTVARREYNRRCPNYLLYWTMIADSIAAGSRRFDMGRSEQGSPQHLFKRNWGARDVALSYAYLLAPGRAPPRLDPNNPRFRLAISAWKRMPLAATRMLGPWVIRGLA